MKNTGSVGKQNELALLSSSSEKQRQAGSGVKAAEAVLVSVTRVDLSELECLPRLSAVRNGYSVSTWLLWWC